MKDTFIYIIKMYYWGFPNFKMVKKNESEKSGQVSLFGKSVESKYYFSNQQVWDELSYSLSSQTGAECY